MAIKDSDYLSKLQNYYAKHHGFPSYARLCNVLGLAAKSAVNKVLLRLAEQGYLKRTADEVWVPAESFFERNLSGTPVVAGLPTFISDVKKLIKREIPKWNTGFKSIIISNLYCFNACSNNLSSDKMV